MHKYIHTCIHTRIRTYIHIPINGSIDQWSNLRFRSDDPQRQNLLHLSAIRERYPVAVIWSNLDIHSQSVRRSPAQFTMINCRNDLAEFIRLKIILNLTTLEYHQATLVIPKLVLHRRQVTMQTETQRNYQSSYFILNRAITVIATSKTSIFDEHVSSNWFLPT